MKNNLLRYFFYFAITLSIPLITTILTHNLGTHNTKLSTDEASFTVNNTLAVISLSKQEYITGAVAAMMANEDFSSPSASEIAKLYAVLINTLIKTNPNIQESLTSLTREQRKLLWQDNFSTNESALNFWLSEVSDLIITYNKTPITPYYHPLSAGMTRNGDIMYLKNAETFLDMEDTNFLQVIEIPYQQLYDLIFPGITIDNPQNIQIISRDNASYVTEISLNNRIMSGENFSTILNLPSSSFNIILLDNSVKIITKGIGNGYGISLNYAKYLASKQYTYDKIINYFFDNIEIVSE